MSNFKQQAQNDLNRNIGILEKEMSEDMQKMHVKYWEAYIEGISVNASLKVDLKNIIAINGDIVCDLDKKTDVAMAQAYSFGNSILPWSNTWSGASQANWFRMYQTFMNDIHPTPAKGADPKMEAQLDSLNKKILAFHADIGSLLKSSMSTYMSNYCVKKGKTPFSCEVLVPGSPTMLAYIDKYKKSAEYKKKVTYLEDEYNDNLNGLQDEYDKIASEYYGSNYKIIREAEDVINRVDPDSSDNLNEVKVLPGQMSISDSNGSRIVPAFTVSNLDDYKQWLAKTKKAAADNKDPSIKVSFTEQDTSIQSYSSSFSSHCNSFFYASNEHEERSAIDIVDDKLTASFSYQDIFQVSLTPSNTWYFENMLSEFRDYYSKHPGSTLSGKKLWGEGGLFNVGVIGLVIGYGGCIKIESSEWGSTKVHDAYSSNQSIGFGPISFSKSQSGKDLSGRKVESTHNGINIKDTSGMAKIIAVITHRPNA